MRDDVVLSDQLLRTSSVFFRYIIIFSYQSRDRVIAIIYQSRDRVIAITYQSRDRVIAITYQSRDGVLMCGVIHIFFYIFRHSFASV